MASLSPVSIEPPFPVDRPILLQRWSDLVFLHWRYPVEEVARLLPPGLVPDVFDGSAWMGLIGFRMLIRFPWHPPVPLLSHFPEVNVRTYVRGPGGREGIWFLSLDITRLLPVLAARWFWQVPYMWSRMTMAWSGPRLRFTARRRWPPARAATSFEIERSGASADLSDVDHFVTARWGLFVQRRGRLSYIQVHHPAWPLERASLIHVDDTLMQAAGLPIPRGEPVAHYSPGVLVRFGHIQPAH